MWTARIDSSSSTAPQPAGRPSNCHGPPIAQHPAPTAPTEMPLAFPSSLRIGRGSPGRLSATRTLSAIPISCGRSGPAAKENFTADGRAGSYGPTRDGARRGKMERDAAPRDPRRPRRRDRARARRGRGVGRTHRDVRRLRPASSSTPSGPGRSSRPTVARQATPRSSEGGGAMLVLDPRRRRRAGARGARRMAGERGAHEVDTYVADAPRIRWLEANGFAYVRAASTSRARHRAAAAPPRWPGGIDVTPYRARGGRRGGPCADLRRRRLGRGSRAPHHSLAGSSSLLTPEHHGWVARHAGRPIRPRVASHVFSDGRGLGGGARRRP